MCSIRMFFVKKQISLRRESIADLPNRDDGTHVVAPDLAYRRLALVNVAFLGRPGAGDRQWTLIDAGGPGLGSLIESAASERFGQGCQPGVGCIRRDMPRGMFRFGGKVIAQ